MTGALDKQCSWWGSNSRFFRRLFSRIYPELLFTVLYLATYSSVCVCVFSSHSFWTSSSLDVPAGVTQEEGHTGFLIHLLSAARALIFLARRIQPFLSLVDGEVEFCVLMIQSFSTRWAFLFLVRKIPFAGIELTSQRVRGLRGTSKLPGRQILIGDGEGDRDGETREHRTWNSIVRPILSITII